MFLDKLGGVLLACLVGTSALAQTSGNFQTGQTLTANELNAAFALKMDYASMPYRGISVWQFCPALE